MRGTDVKFAALAVTMLMVVSCSKDPEDVKRDFVTSGDRFVQEEKYNEAVIEYLNALQITPTDGPTRYKLAQAYERMNDSANAAKEYVRAASALPKDVKVQVDTAVALLQVQRYEDAREHATTALALDPTNFTAQFTLGNALAGLRDFSASLEQLDEAMKLDPKAPLVQTVVGAVQMAVGNPRDAERAFRRAIELSPDAPAAHLALANFLWSSGRAEEAEEALKKVLTLDPNNSLAHRGLATLYLSTKRLPLAESHLRAMADADRSPAGTVKLSLADYYVLIGKPEQALQTLDSMKNLPEAQSAVQIRMAALRYVSGGPPAGHAILDAVLQREPMSVEALLLKARFLRAENKLPEALKMAEAAAAADAKSAQAFYLIGVIAKSQQRLAEASTAFTEVLKLNPRAADAQMQLADLNLALGRPDQAIPLATGAIRENPRDLQARLMLIRAQAATGDQRQAERMMGELLKALPSSAPVKAAEGSLALNRRDFAGARRSFGRALELEPPNMEAFTGLILVDLAEKKVDSARSRADARLAKTPNDPVLLTIAARVHATTGDLAGAETMLRKVITLEPANLQAYGMLGQVYSLQQRLPQALATFEDVLKREPDSIPINTIVAILHANSGKTDEARKRYERILQIDSGAAVAANNLAYIYAEEGGNLDVALGLAQTAKQKLPDNPQVADTLGWIYVKKNMTSLALPVLQDAVARAPSDAYPHYHLGVALARMGQAPKARQMLERALALNLEPTSAAEARKLIAAL